MHRDTFPDNTGGGQELDLLPAKHDQTAIQVGSVDGPRLASDASEPAQGDAGRDGNRGVVAELPPQQKWNDPKINIGRVILACYGLTIMGAHDGAVGALLPYIESYYDVSYVVVSILFVSPILGFVLSALFLNLIHEKYGQRGVAILGASTRLAAYIAISQHPPFPVVACAFSLTGFGNGLEDAAWNAWIGHLRNANEVLGVLHGAYGLGGILSPFISTAMVTRFGQPWYSFSYVMVGLLALEQIVSPWIFWTSDGSAWRARYISSSDPSSKTVNTLAAVCRSRVVWICSLFLLIYVGTEVSMTGWMNTFLQTVRHAPPFEAGLSTTMFWVGATVGRVSLGFVTGRVGEKLAIFVYLAVSLGCHLLLYLVPSTAVSLASIAVEGFFLGPLFPAAIVAATRLLPPHLHVSGVGVAATLGSTGACLLPFAVGAIAEAKGVQVLMPVVLAFLAADVGIWACLPSLKRQKRE